MNLRKLPLISRAADRLKMRRRTDAHKAMNIASTRAAREIHSAAEIESLESRVFLSVAKVGSPTVITTTDSNAGVEVATDAAGDSAILYGLNGVSLKFRNAAGQFSAPIQIQAPGIGLEVQHAVAMDASGDCIVVWVELDSAHTAYVIEAQRFHVSNGAATAVGGNFQINSNSDADIDTWVSVASADPSGDFVVTWPTVTFVSTGILTRNYTGHVTAQAFNFSTLAASAEIQIDTSPVLATATVGPTIDPVVAANANGQVVFAWANNAMAEARRYQFSGAGATPSLTAVDSQEVMVSDSLEEGPAVAIDDQGDYTVASEESYYDSTAQQTTDSIFFRQYNQTSGTFGAPVHVSPSSSYNSPAVVYDSDGSILVSWLDGTFSSYGQNFIVFGRRYDAADVADPQGGFNVNSTAYSGVAGRNYFVSLAALPNHAYIDAWNSDSDTQGTDITIQELALKPVSVSSVATSEDSAAITSGEIVTASLPALIVRFNGSLATSGAGSVTNTANFSLLRDGTDVTSSTISSITYAFNASNGAYEATLNLSAPLPPGNYVLTAHQSLLDADGRPIDGDANGSPGGDFTLSFATPTIPVAAITAPVVGSTGQVTETITVAYTDNLATINPATIATGNITVTAPDGSMLLVTSAVASGSGNNVTGTYTVAAPAGTFTYNDDGIYTIAIAANSAVNANANGNIATAGSFSVALPVPPLSAVVFAPDVTTVGTATETVFVIYTDATATVDPSTLASSNITVTSPSGAALVVSYTGATQGGTSIEASYSVAAPNGAFTNADVGSYVVTVVGGSVKDTNGNMVPQTRGSFLFNPFEDPNFGPLANGGATHAGNVGVLFSAQDVMPQADGNILIVGLQGDATNGTAQGVLEQLTSDGVLDMTFGTNGLTLTPAGNNDQFYSAAVQSDGKIIAVGGSNGSFLVARYNADGSLDTTFGASGFATAGFGADGPATAYSVALQSDGGIVVAGGSTAGMLAIARFTAGGALDSTFNPGGVDDATFPAGGQRTITTDAASAASQILIDPQNKIVGVGSDGAHVVAFRLDADGSNDPSFGMNGLQTITQLASQDSSQALNAEDLALQPGGNILISGQEDGGGFAVVRLTSIGQFDTTFGSDGLITATFGGANEAADSVVVNPTTGEFMLIGTTTLNNTTQTGIAAFNSDGSPNTNFGINNSGQTTLPSASIGTVNSATTNSVRPHALHPQNSDFAFGRLQGDGQLIVGASNSVKSSLRRLKVVGVDGAMPVAIGSTPRTRLAPFKLTDGTTVTITLQGGSGTVSQDGNNVSLNITNGNPAVTIHTKGGANAVTLSSMAVTGNLRSLLAATATMAGTLSIAGVAGTIRLKALSGMLRTAGSISNLNIATVSGSVSCGNVLVQTKFSFVTGTIAAVNIRNFSAIALEDATVLAGVKLGAPAGPGVAAVATTYGPGEILTLNISGTVSSSFIAAGAMPPAGGALGGGSDTLAGPGSLIRSMVIRAGIDSTTRFETGVFPHTVRIVKPLIPANDPLHRFIVLT